MFCAGEGHCASVSGRLPCTAAGPACCCAARSCRCLHDSSRQLRHNPTASPNPLPNPLPCRRRHAAELASIEGAKERTAAEAIAVADSLYSVHLGEGGQEGGQEGGHGKASAGQGGREVGWKAGQGTCAGCMCCAAELNGLPRPASCCPVHGGCNLPCVHSIDTLQTLKLQPVLLCRRSPARGSGGGSSGSGRRRSERHASQRSWRHWGTQVG